MDAGDKSDISDSLKSYAVVFGVDSLFGSQPPISLVYKVGVDESDLALTCDEHEHAHHIGVVPVTSIPGRLLRKPRPPVTVIETHFFDPFWEVVPPELDKQFTSLTKVRLEV